MIDRFRRWFYTEASTALLIGVMCQVSLILVVGAIVVWVLRLSEVSLGQSFWGGVSVVTIGACLLCPFILMFRGQR
jgi:hypothetical protein